MKRIYAKIYNFYNIYGEKEGKAALTKYCISDKPSMQKTILKPRRKRHGQDALSHTAAAVGCALRSSALGICGSLRITDRFVTEYVTSFALNLIPRLEAALEFGDVSNIFI